MSYSRADAEMAERLARDLRTREGVDVWLDNWEIQPGDHIIQSIEKALLSCEYFLLLLSPASAESKFVEYERDAWLMLQIEAEQEEKNAKRKMHRKLIPVFYGDVLVPPFLKPINYLRINSDDSNYERIVKELSVTFHGKDKRPAILEPTPPSKTFSIEEQRVSERLSAHFLLKQLLQNQFDEVLRCLDPDGWVQKDTSRQECEISLMKLMEQRGPQWWSQLQETILAVRSPFSPFDGYSLDSWVSNPEGNWRLDDGQILGLGIDTIPIEDPKNEDLRMASLLTWEGLKFLNGDIKARMWMPELPQNCAAGFVLRHRNNRTAVVGLIRYSPNDAEFSYGLWQRIGMELEEIKSLSLTSNLKHQEWYDFSFGVRGRRATIYVDQNDCLSVTLPTDFSSGHFGLIKLSGAVVRFQDLSLEVFADNSIFRSTNR